MKKIIFRFLRFSFFYALCFSLCYFWTVKCGHVLYAGYTLGDYRFWGGYWILCSILLVFRRNLMICLMETGCVLSILAAQVTGAISVKKSILKFDDSDIVLPCAMAVFMLIGIALELYQKRKFRKAEYFILILAFLVNLVAGYHFVGVLQLHQGAERGYLAGYEQGLADGRRGVDRDDSRSRGEKVLEEGFTPGSAKWSGYLQYYSSGYSAGQKDAEK